MPYLTFRRPGIVGLHLLAALRRPGVLALLKDSRTRHRADGLAVARIHSRAFQSSCPNITPHIWSSCRRIFIAFAIATGVGVPLGLFMGWSKVFREYTFPILELLRPIPILAWVPLAILMFAGFETPVIFLATLASLFVTTLNTLLGVDSIDEEYFRAAGCLGSSKWQIFKNVVVPGALPFIFTGLQISIGVAWFSLVAAEMVSGDYGLGIPDRRFIHEQCHRPNGHRHVDPRHRRLDHISNGSHGRQPPDAVARQRTRPTGQIRYRKEAISMSNQTAEGVDTSGQIKHPQCNQDL